MISITSCARILTHRYTLTDCAVAWSHLILSRRESVLRRDNHEVRDSPMFSKVIQAVRESTAKTRVQCARSDSRGSSRILCRDVHKNFARDKATLRSGTVNSRIGRPERKQVPPNAHYYLYGGIMGTDDERFFKSRMIPL